MCVCDKRDGNEKFNLISAPLTSLDFNPSFFVFLLLMIENSAHCLPRDEYISRYQWPQVIQGMQWISRKALTFNCFQTSPAKLWSKSESHSYIKRAIWNLARHFCDASCSCQSCSMHSIMQIHLHWEKRLRVLFLFWHLPSFLDRLSVDFGFISYLLREVKLTRLWKEYFKLQNKNVE
jgi:hypothetical protein